MAIARFRPLGSSLDPFRDLNDMQSEMNRLFDSFFLSIAGDMLTLKGERQWSQEAKQDNVYRNERWFGEFERTLPLPIPVQADKVKATYRDGVLTVSLPKAEELKPKEIKIDVL